MCYYSRSMRRDEFRGAKENEDLTVQPDGTGHTVLRAASDNKIVCVASGSMINIENLQVNRENFRQLNPSLQWALQPLIGKAVRAEFREYHHNGGHYAADALVIDGMKVHLAWLKSGTKCYIGDARVSLETRLGVDDPSIVHDHKPIDEQPGIARAMGRALGLCSIVR